MKRSHVYGNTSVRPRFGTVIGGISTYRAHTIPVPSAHCALTGDGKESGVGPVSGMPGTRRR